VTTLRRNTVARFDYVSITPPEPGAGAKKSILFAISATLLLPSLVLAQSAFVGSRKADLNNMQMPTKPGRYLLDKGLWHCLTWVPKISVKADGMDHKVAGHPYYDTVSIKVIDDQTITETDKRQGKTIWIGRNSVSADGKSMTTAWKDTLHGTSGSFSSLKQ
jgi:hypothetical protein